MIAIIGGGAAGMMAAISAAENDAKVVLLEKMPQVGRKLMITGKGRCNVTNVADVDVFMRNFPGNGRFLHSSLRKFCGQDLCNWLARQGVKTKVERGGRVFPESDQAVDVVKALRQACEKAGVEIRIGCPVEKLIIENQRVTKVRLTSGEELDIQAAIVATGGASYPATGSSGDGYRLLGEAGHTIVAARAALTPIVVSEEWIADLEGLSLRNVSAKLCAKGKIIAEEFGEMLFTDCSLSGPIMLTLSRKAGELLAQKKDDISIRINLKPALSEEILDQRIQRDMIKFGRRQFKNSLGALLPAKLIPIIVDLSYIEPDKPVNQLNRNERKRLLALIRDFEFTVKSLAPLKQAIVTAGGVSVKEIEPAMMRSKLINNLYVAGELLDVDGNTGGYNLQAAFSTGWVAGWAAAQQLNSN